MAPHHMQGEEWSRWKFNDLVYKEEAVGELWTVSLWDNSKFVELGIRDIVFSFNFASFLMKNPFQKMKKSKEEQFSFIIIAKKHSLWTSFVFSYNIVQLLVYTIFHRSHNKKGVNPRLYVHVWVLTHLYVCVHTYIFYCNIQMYIQHSAFILLWFNNW